MLIPNEVFSTIVRKLRVWSYFRIMCSFGTNQRATMVVNANPVRRTGCPRLREAALQGTGDQRMGRCESTTRDAWTDAASPASDSDLSE